MTTQRMLPLYEAKMLDGFDHRDADVIKSATAGKRQNQPRYLTEAQHEDPSRFPVPMAWVREEVMPSIETLWLMGFSDVTSSSNERTIISSALPRYPVGHTYPLVFAPQQVLILALFNSFVLDFMARQKVAGLHLTYTYVRQFPVPRPELFKEQAPWATQAASSWVERRTLELMYTAYDMRAFAEDLGDDGEPFVWDPERRFWLRAELDAAFFHLYGVEREDVDYIMETFPIVKRKDMAAYGSFRTKEAILKIYDAMADAVASGKEYQTVLAPPPGDGPRHPAQEGAS